MQRFEYCYADYTDLLNKCPFTAEERCVLDMRRKSKSIIEMAFILNCSERTVSRLLSSVQRKILTELTY